MKKDTPVLIIKWLSVLLIIFSISACGLISVRSAPEKLFASVAQRSFGSTQMLIAVNDDSRKTAAKVYAIEERQGKWHLVFDPFDAVIGRNGFAVPNNKREGDGKTPSGKFYLQRTFGYDVSINTRLSYRQAGPDDLWVDDPTAGDYNQWVKKQETAAESYEWMKRNDDLYKYGIVIEYNTSPVVKGYGSAIFIHVWGGKDSTTEGCIAVSEENILRILRWLDPEAKPVIIMGAEDMIWEVN
jgi:L,D-peptidoglycan transpeptidase YkuD (ErfK/YbiS/YcfS/YnhG family)